VRVISSSHDSLKTLIYQRFEAFIFAKNQQSCEYKFNYILLTIK